jgi:4-amino-4-deoxy-L-arabinose transferase-like glycosyltransferase
MTFLGDEGRDAIIVRRFLTDFDLIAIGPGTSIGNMYLGPVYYYLMAPALLLANFSPIGPAVQIALLGVATIFFVWYVAREWFGKYAAFVASFIYAIAPKVIYYSRSSWNPNIMPFFALLTIWSLWKLWRQKKHAWLIVTGISVSFMLQSHYLGLVILPVVFVFWFLSFLSFKKEKKLKPFFKSSIIASIIVFLFLSPLVVFDAKHGWRNFMAMKKFFTERQATVSAKPWSSLPNMWPNFEQINTRLITGTDKVAGKWTAIGIVVGVIWLLFLKIKGKLAETKIAAFFILSVWMLFALVGLGIYKQHIYDHYYGFFFPAPFLLVGGIVEELIYKFKKRIMPILFVLFAVLVWLNIKNNDFWHEPNRQLARSIAMAEKIKEESGEQPFNIAVVAERNYEGAYQYFLEKDSTKIVIIDPQRADETIAEQLFVVCELPEEKCMPTSNPKAEIANFGWSKIEKMWEVSGAILYKLVHNR